MATDTVGERVRRYRRLRKWTQEELAEASGSTKAYIGKIEAGVIAEPGLDVQRRIAKALGIPLRVIADPAWYEGDELEPDDIEAAVRAHPKWDNETKETVIRIIRLADASLPDEEDADSARRKS